MTAPALLRCHMLLSDWLTVDSSSLLCFSGVLGGGSAAGPEVPGPVHR